MFRHTCLHENVSQMPCYIATSNKKAIVNVYTVGDPNVFCSTKNNLINR